MNVSRRKKSSREAAEGKPLRFCRRLAMECGSARRPHPGFSPRLVSLGCGGTPCSSRPPRSEGKDGSSRPSGPVGHDARSRRFPWKDAMQRKLVEAAAPFSRRSGKGNRPVPRAGVASRQSDRIARKGQTVGHRRQGFCTDTEWHQNHRLIRRAVIQRGPTLDRDGRLCLDSHLEARRT